MNNGFGSVMESLLKGVDSVLSTKTVFPEALSPVIPIRKVFFFS